MIGSRKRRFGGFKLPEEPVAPRRKVPEVSTEVAKDDAAETAVPDGEGEDAVELDELKVDRPKVSLAGWLATSTAAAKSGDIEGSFEPFSTEGELDGGDEQALLQRLREAIAKVMPDRPFSLEPHGSFVTDLAVPSVDQSSEAARSELGVALLFHDCRAVDDSEEAETVREEVIRPAIDSLVAWLRTQARITVKDVAKKVPVPYVVFETKELSVTLSVQHPFGLLASWHLRDLCRSGWPGRLRALARLAKAWARGKLIDSPKEGTLSAYGYELLVASYLQECGVLPALLPFQAAGPYVEADEALRQALDSCEDGAGRCELWRAGEPTAPDFTEAAGWDPTQFFQHWLEWMADTVFGYVDMSKEELREDLALSPKLEAQWAPESHDLYFAIEDPLSGENVGRSVGFKGFCAIRAEVHRAKKFFETTELRDSELPTFQQLLKLPPLSKAGAGKPQPQQIQPAPAQDYCQPVSDGKALSTNPASNVCWDWMRGNCKKGGKCKWLHAGPEPEAGD